MKRTLAVLVLFLLVTSAWGEDDVFRYPLNSQTMESFTRTSENLSVHPLILGNFSQERFLSRFNRSLFSSGNFIIAAELGMLWETLEPFPSTMTLGRDYIVQSRPGGQRTVLSAQGNETFLSLAEVLSTVFSGHVQRLLDNFEVYFSGTPAAWEMGLIPKDRAIALFARRIIMKGDQVIRSILINEQNGDSISYTLSNHRHPHELTERENAHFFIP